MMLPISTSTKATARQASSLVIAITQRVASLSRRTVAKGKNHYANT